MNVVEHEMMVHTTKGVIPKSALHAVNEAAKDQAPPPDMEPKKLDKTCPIRSNRFDARCSTDCALYTGTSCGIVEHRMGSGTVCPFPGMAHCGENCALFTDGGCALVK